jgi:hypothetical protein
MSTALTLEKPVSTGLGVIVAGFHAPARSERQTVPRLDMPLPELLLGCTPPAPGAVSRFPLPGWTDLELGHEVTAALGSTTPRHSPVLSRSPSRGSSRRTTTPVDMLRSIKR